jgi:hypothetical protein
MVGRPQFTSEEVVTRGKALYESEIRSHVETDENIGKLISIDIETGEYEIGDDRSLDAPRRLHSRHPDAAICTLRIGYKAVDVLGGILERETLC